MQAHSSCQSSAEYRVEAEWPQFPTLAASFNEEIESTLKAEIKAFKQQCRENWPMWQKAHSGPSVSAPPGSPFVFIGSWEQAQLNQAYVSFLVHIYSFSGGAHGTDQLYAFNYDVAGSSVITIEDFLGHSRSALGALAKKASKRIDAQLASEGWHIDQGMKDMIARGAEPVPSNFQVFTFDDYTLTLHFQRYQVAPGAAGPVTVELARTSLPAPAPKYYFCRCQDGS